MIECFMAWMLLFLGIVNMDSGYLIASAGFAIAAELYAKRKGID